MKKVMSLFIILAMVIAMTVPGLAEKAENDEILSANLDSIAHREDGRALLGLAVEVIDHNEVVFSYATGVRYTDSINTENDLPFGTDTKVRIASVSKTFTAVGIMQLYEAGMIDLDADVSDYLGFSLRNPAYPDTPITVRMLLSHTSSILDGDAYSTTPDHTLAEFFTPGFENYEEGAHFSQYEPGTYFEYSNLGFGTLGTIIEAVSGERFDCYMTDHILAPMGLTASFNMSAMTSEDRSNVATVYRKEWDEGGYALADSIWNAQVDDPSVDIPDNTAMVSNPDTSTGFEYVSLDNYVPGTNATCMSPQGGLRISADELTQWALMFMNDGTAGNGAVILKSETVDLMLTPHWTWNGSEEEDSNGDPAYGLFQQWGLGLQLITNGMNNEYGDTFVSDGRIENLVGHYGDAYGMFSIFMFDRENDCGFVYIINGAECDLEDEPAYGEYSENWIWEEQIATAIYDTYLINYKK